VHASLISADQNEFGYSDDIIPVVI